MAYVVYNLKSKRLHKVYSTERGAKIARAAANRKAGIEVFDVMDEKLFNEKHNGLVTVKNLLSGKEVQINEQSVGTCCDPSTESYWSM